MLGSQAFHEVCLPHNSFLGRWWLTHECWRIWRETVYVHLGEVNCCVLAGAGEDDGSQEFVQLDATGKRWRNTMVCMAWFIGIAIVMQIFDPILKLVVLE